MAKIKINKIEAAQRQLDAAIRMLFANDAPVAIHTLAMAAFRILRDLAAKSGGCSIHTFIESIIKPGKEKSFWGGLHGFANFLKHADKDPSAISSAVDEQVNDFALMICCRYYHDLGQKFTHEMIVLVSWCIALYPDLVRDDMPSILRASLSQVRTGLVGKTRNEQLAVGQHLLKKRAIY